MGYLPLFKRSAITAGRMRIMNDKTRVERALISEGDQPIDEKILAPTALLPSSFPPASFPPASFPPAPFKQGQLYRRGIAALYAREKAVADFRRVSRRLLGV